MTTQFSNKTVSRTAGFVFKMMGDEGVLVEITQNVVNMDKVYTLNQLGVFVYQQLNQPRAVDYLLENILAEFDVSTEIATTDLKEFLEESEKMGIIEIA